jgi:hypothetical protein
VSLWEFVYIRSEYASGASDLSRVPSYEYVGACL